MIGVIDLTPLFVVGFLVFLEGILSLDNALVLALMVKHLPQDQQRRALTWGIWGAVIFRFIALFFLTALMSLSWIKFVGGAYLLWIAGSHFVSKGQSSGSERSSPLSFWRTVLMVEVMDIAFSVDSILAAVSLTQSYWIVVLGGVLGIIMMRFAATIFVKLLAIFPKLEHTAYLLIAIIGAKLIIQGFNIPGIDFHSSKSIASWLFWFAMVGAIFSGLGRQKQLSDACMEDCHENNS